MKSLLLHLYGVLGILGFTQLVFYKFALKSFSSQKCLFFGVVALMNVNVADALDVFMRLGTPIFLAHCTAIIKPAAPSPGS